MIGRELFIYMGYEGRGLGICARSADPRGRYAAVRGRCAAVRGRTRPYAAAARPLRGRTRPYATAARPHSLAGWASQADVAWVARKLKLACLLTMLADHPGLAH